MDSSNLATVTEGQDLEQPEQPTRSPAAVAATKDSGESLFGLSVVSKQYDRGNKGYLDKTGASKLGLRIDGGVLSFQLCCTLIMPCCCCRYFCFSHRKETS